MFNTSHLLAVEQLMKRLNVQVNFSSAARGKSDLQVKVPSFNTMLPVHKYL